MKKYAFLALIALLAVFAGCSKDDSTNQITGENKAAEVVQNTQSSMTIAQVLVLAQNTECTEKGTLTEDSFYNPNSRTWWIGLEMKPEFYKDICNPACVVSEETKKAEINWRCTGLK